MRLPEIGKRVLFAVARRRFHQPVDNSHRAPAAGSSARQTSRWRAQRRRGFEPPNPKTAMSPMERMPDAAKTDLDDLQRRADAIGRVPLFRSWPAPALLRLARAASVTSHAPGALVVAGGPKNGVLSIIVDGTALASVSDPEGRRVIFKMAAGASMYGFIDMVDGKEAINDVIALDRLRAIRIPHAAVRAELQAAPELWESIAIELAARARYYTDQMKRFVFDQPRVHLAVLLTNLARATGIVAQGHPVSIEQRLSQDMIAEMLGISRQWASTLIRDMVNDGVVRWRYGRVTVLDFERLRTMAELGINARR
jgi:CRP/FNR family transcriptional regulator, cyclic AMP receptor protein